MKVDLAEIYQGASEFANTQITELEKAIQRRVDERSNFETRLEEVSREPGIYIQGILFLLYCSSVLPDSI